MTPYYDDGRVALHVGHVLDVLAGLEPGSVQTVVTSPPYWGLRSYGTDPQVWGGDPSCSHSLEETAPGKVLTGGHGTASAKQVTNAGSQYGNAWQDQGTRTNTPPRDHAGALAFGDTRGEEAHRNGTALRQSLGAVCTRCGAWSGELGSESTPEQYVANIVAVFRAVRRVLHDTGTVWCNLGDSYAGSGKGPAGATSMLNGGRGVDADEKVARRTQEVRQGFVNQRSDAPGLKPKDLVGIPWRVAFALQADGWYLRSAITWAKKSPMPESVRDRPTNATEMIFLFSKRASYFFDLEAVRGISDIRPSGVVETANLADKSVVLGSNLGLSAPPSTGARSPSAVDHRWLCIQDAVGYATAFLQGPELQREFGLPSFNAEVRQQLTDYAHRVLISGAPVIHRPPVTPLRLADAYVAAEEFLQQLHSLGVTLANDDALRIGLRPPLMTDSPGVRTNTDATVRVDDACEISQQQLSFHDQEYSTSGDTTPGSGANLRNFWLLGPEPYPQAHFATFVSEIPRRAILAGTSARGQCPACGAPWARAMGHTCEHCGTVRPANSKPCCEAASDWQDGRVARDEWLTDAHAASKAPRQPVAMGNSKQSEIGWRPTCQCNAGDPVPQVCLDPFAGSGTTLAVARWHQRRAVGIELNPEYARLIEQRLAQGVLL